MQWTSTERSGQRAFLLIEGFALFVLAPLLSFIGALGGPAIQTLAEGYVKYASKLGCWFGVISMPASLAWVFLIAIVQDRARPRAAELARLLTVEVAAVALIAVLYIALGPAAMEGAPEWSDLWLFGKLLAFSGVFWLCAAICALPYAIRRRERRRASNQSAPVRSE